MDFWDKKEMLQYLIKFSRLFFSNGLSWVKAKSDSLADEGNVDTNYMLSCSHISQSPI